MFKYTLRYQVYVENKELTWVQLYTNIQPVNMPQKVGNRLQILCNTFAHLEDAGSKGGGEMEEEGGRELWEEGFADTQIKLRN